MPVYTIILTMYDANIEYIKESLNSVLGQTYKNTEVILINNGAGGKVEELIWSHFVKNKNAKLIHSPKNLYNPTAEILHDPLINLWNAGLFCSVGDYIYFMSYDDFVSTNYAELMVKLFIENDKCQTVAPMVVSVNEKSEVNIEISEIFRKKNQRSRYTSGIPLAESYMKNENQIVFPGGLLGVRSELVLNNGGFDSMCDLSQLFKLGIHGESGFDPEARLSWRHHAEQTNKFQTKLGLIYYSSFKKHYEVYKLYELHLKIGGKKFAEEYRNFLADSIDKSALSAFRKSYRLNFVSGILALGRIFFECPPPVIFRAIFYAITDLPLVVYYKLFNLLRRSQAVRSLYKKIKN